jgi:hypothetical protein
MLARKAGFNGVLEVYGYGVSGVPGIQHRRAMRTGVEKGVILADYGANLIRVWMASSCAAAEFEDLKPHEEPLAAFSHELGHHVIACRGKTMLPHIEEAVAERYGRMLLRSM